MQMDFIYFISVIYALLTFYREYFVPEEYKSWKKWYKTDENGL